MAAKLFIGGLSYSTQKETLEQLFAEVGTVESAVIVMDRFSGESKGFGFVELSSPQEAAEAIAKFDGHTLDGRRITVSQARERPDRRREPRGGDFRHDM